MAPPIAQSPDPGSTWIDRFHAGRRDVLEACYRDHFETVKRAIGQVLNGADRETVIHDVFLQLLANADLRRSFKGGTFASWIGAVARNRAVDYWRRHRREATLDGASIETASADSGARMEADLEAPSDRAVPARRAAGQVGGRVRVAVPRRARPARGGAAPRHQPHHAGLP
jgi:RNA polymerase sigma-70 factor (ECF subfamily)